MSVMMTETSQLRNLNVISGHLAWFQRAKPLAASQLESHWPTKKFYWQVVKNINQTKPEWQLLNKWAEHPMGSVPKEKGGIPSNEDEFKG